MACGIQALRRSSLGRMTRAYAQYAQNTSESWTISSNANMQVHKTLKEQILKELCKELHLLGTQQCGDEYHYWSNMVGFRGKHECKPTRLLDTGRYATQKFWATAAYYLKERNYDGANYFTGESASSGEEVLRNIIKVRTLKKLALNGTSSSSGCPRNFHDSFGSLRVGRDFQRLFESSGPLRRVSYKYY